MPAKVPRRKQAAPLPEETAGVTKSDFPRLMSGLKDCASDLLRGEGRQGRLTPTELVQSGLRRQKRASQPWSSLRWKNESHFRAATYGHMIRSLKDKMRSANRRPDRVHAGNLASEFLAPLVEEGVLDLDDLIHGDDAPSALQAALAEALDQLRRAHPEIAETIHLVHWRGFTQEETARLMDVDVRTVRNRLQRGYALLLEHLTDNGPAGNPVPGQRPKPRPPLARARKRPHVENPAARP
jgi:DNA-directed RNA polymerase specialized sigma24 family protein